MSNPQTISLASSPVIQSANSAMRIPELDGLRGLAILLVLICHYVGNATHYPLGFLLDHIFSAMAVGWSGVDLFFVLSGFLIGGILLESRDSPRYFQTFYIRRVHRILPIYYLWIISFVTIVSIIVFSLRQFVLLPPDGVTITSYDLSSIPYYLTFTQNIFYSPTRFEWIWFTVTWSLAIEEQFYLVAPPLIRFLSQKRLIIVLVTLVVLAPVLRFISFKYFQNLDHFYQFAMLCRSDALSLGILTAIAWRSTSFQNYLSDHPKLFPRIVVYMGVGIFALLWWLARPASLVTVTIGYTWLAFYYAALLVLVLSQTASWPARLMRVRWLGKLGGISYCVYLIHLTINQLAHRILLHADPAIYTLRGVLVTIGSLVLTLTIASFSWRLVEKPLIRRGHKASY